MSEKDEATEVIEAVMRLQRALARVNVQDYTIEVNMPSKSYWNLAHIVYRDLHFLMRAGLPRAPDKMEIEICGAKFIGGRE